MVAEFNAGALQPERVGVLFPTDVDGGAIDDELPPTLVVLIDLENVVPAVAHGVRSLMAERATRSLTEWEQVTEYRIGWTAVAQWGKPGEIAVAAAKVNLDVRKPVPFVQSFRFDLTQVLPVVKAAMGGGMFAVATVDQVHYLASRRYSDVLEMLPIFELPASAELPPLIEEVESAIG
jgi:hypothetical protein